MTASVRPIRTLVALRDVDDEDFRLRLSCAGHGFLDDGDRRLAVVERDVVHGSGDCVCVLHPDELSVVRHADDELAAVGICESNDGSSEVIGMNWPLLE